MGHANFKHGQNAQIQIQILHTHAQSLIRAFALLLIPSLVSNDSLAESRGSDHTTWMCRLIWTFSVHIRSMTRFRMVQSIWGMNTPPREMTLTKKYLPMISLRATHKGKDMPQLGKYYANWSVCIYFSFFFLIWVLWPFQEYFTYIEPIVHQRWVKTGEPGEKPPDHP